MENNAKRNLRDTFESKYWVTISDGAFDMAVQDLRTFDSKPISGDVSPEKILEAASKLVFEMFENCAYETSLYEKAYELRWALVEIFKLGLKTDPETKAWMHWCGWVRGSAAVFMNTFLEIWEDVLESSGGTRILTPQCADKLSFFKDINNYASSSLKTRLDVGEFLEAIKDSMISAFGPLLTVTRSDVAEVVSNLTDVPSTLILLPSYGIDKLKEKAMNMMNKRLAEQQHVIDEIYETLASPRRIGSSSTRPRGSFLLLGQSGAGKTEMAKAVAEHWYCDATRLVEIDMSEYAEESDLWRRLAEVVAKRPYSVIVFDKIEKATPSVTRVLIEVLSKEAPSEVDLSNSIIFLTSGVGSDWLALFCKSHLRDEDAWRQFILNPEEFLRTHDCILKGSGPERALIEAKKHLSSDVLDSLDKVLAMQRFGNYRAVCRLLLREIVRQVTGQRLVVHASDDVLNLLVKRDADRFREEGGKALKRLLLEHVIPLLPAEQDLNNVIACVDLPVHGSSQLSLSLQRLEQSVDDRYFKQQDGAFDKSIANFRTKVESVCRMFKWRSEYVPWLDRDSDGPALVGKLLVKLLVNTRNEILTWAPRDIARTESRVPPRGLNNVTELRKRKRFVEDEREKKQQRGVKLPQLRTVKAPVLACLLFTAYVALFFFL